ncbi:MAG: UPF0182 family protein [Dehalococcoidales bacterium]|nr:UPF0182 family protein [Dehalococcoidales bacterium]
MDSFERQWQRWFPEDNKKTSGSKKASRIIWIIGIIIGLFIILNVGKGFYAEWLWFNDLGYSSVYATVIGTRVLVFFVAAVIFALLFGSNILLATRLVPKMDNTLLPWQIVKRLQPVLKLVIIMTTVFLSIIFGLVAQNSWEVILRALNWQPFGIVDPVFQKEIGFYVFSLPFMNLLRGWLMGALIITLIGSSVVYLASYGIQRLKFDYSRRVMGHIGGVFVAILGLFAWGYWLGIWDLVYSTRGVVFGASYADMYSKLPAQWILFVIVILFIITVFISIIRRNYRLILYGIGAWIIAAILVGTVYPAIIQRFQVQPSELAKEKEYIEYNIDFTREAFGLNKVVGKPYPAAGSLSLDDINANEATISNVRLWDHRPLKDTFNHIQSLRSYYDFYDVDIDRYVIDGDYREVMLSARELSIDKLPDEALTWVNQRLLYTHGYGITLSPVNEVDSQGLPVLLVKDIPPVGTISVDQPGIYFGEKTNDYIIVNTETQEFDYPAGEENVYGTYEGTAGISLNGFIRRLVYAWELGDFNILISGELTPESRLLYHRNIQERVNHLAPFLLLDGDPYVVVLDGKLYWIQDAYTASDRYPYSTPMAGGLNYIRNSVKVVTDAYNGDVTFYISDPDDALVQTYAAIFPDLFVSMDEMSDEIKAHLRYPEGLFNIQALTYLNYHMTDARVFYNKEDLWEMPREFYLDSEQTMEPYYIIMRLPEEEEEEFLLMMPFTPANKKNTIGWLAARCDGDNYGRLLAYSFSKELWVDGPSQIENRIGQDTVITEQLALWGRGGSTVIRGNLLLIPLGDSILYVEPVFLQAEGGGLPELKRVIVATGEKIAMKPTLAQSLSAIFGEETPVVIEKPETPATETTETPETGTVISRDVADLIEQAQQHFEKAQAYVKDGDWAGFGEEWDKLQSVLQDLAELTGGE